MDPERYEAALEACALRADLETWDGGDLTEVGEKGVQLSGGQQQRLSLCRAVYARTDVLLLDDVLSAVDAHVARHILTQCLTGPLLRGRTVVLVTHQVALTLPAADQVLVIGETGRAVLQGRPKDPQPSPEMAAFLAQHALVAGFFAEGAGAEDGDGAPQAATPAPAATLIRKDGEGGRRVVVAEQKAEGRVKLRVYTAYMMAAGGPVLALLALAMFAGAEALNFFQNKALGAWVDGLEGGGSAATSGDVVPYLAFAGASVAVLVAQSLLAAFCSLLASRRIHHAMAHRVLRAPMSWFEATPVGRITNRFSSDQDTIDTDLMDTTTKFVSRLAAILTITVRSSTRSERVFFLKLDGYSSHSITHHSQPTTGGDRQRHGPARPRHAPHPPLLRLRRLGVPEDGAGAEAPRLHHALPGLLPLRREPRGARHHPRLQAARGVCGGERPARGRERPRVPPSLVGQSLARPPPPAAGLGHHRVRV